MSYTLLQLIAQASNEMGLAAPSSVVGNQTQDVLQMLALSNGLVRDLVREHQWQRITKEYRFTTTYYTYTGDTTNGSATVSSMSSTTGLTSTPTYFSAIGAGINQDTYLTAAGGGTVTLGQAATATGTTVSLTFAQTLYAMPADYDRLVDTTDWDKSKHWQMLGPETAQQWQWLKSGFIATGPRVRFRQLGGFFQVFPPLSSNEYLGFEYVSNYAVLATADVVTPTKASFTVDTDTSVFPDALMVVGLKKRYFEIKGFDYTAFEKQYNMQLQIAKSAEAGSAVLSMCPQPSELLISIANVPDSGYGI